MRFGKGLGRQNLLHPDSAVVAVLARGCLAIDVFFVISGFVIAYSTRELNASAGQFIAPCVPIHSSRVGDGPRNEAHQTSRASICSARPAFPPRAKATGANSHSIRCSGVTFEMLFYSLLAAAMLASRKWKCEICLAAIIALAGFDYAFPRTINGFAGHGYLFEFAAGVLLAQAFIYSPRIPRTLSSNHCCKCQFKRLIICGGCSA